jgi:ADP-heptose:LPS heptosyltransferase
MAQRSSIGGFRVMRRIDQYLGPPVCIALAVLIALRAWLRPQRPAPARIRNVLAIKFWGMGSIVLATPALRALKRSHPEARVTFLTFEQNESVCRMITSIDRVYPYRADGPLAFVASFIALARFLRREQFDVVIDFEFFANFTSIISAISGAAVTVGFQTPKVWRVTFYTKGVSFDHMHITENFLHAVTALGVEADGCELDPLVVSDLAVAPSLQRLLAERGVGDDDRVICINVNASSLDYKRRWPLESYRELIRRLLEHFDGFRLILIGAKDEAPYVATLTSGLPADPNLIDLCGVLSLEQLVLLLQRSRLFIGNDSGPLHLAAAAGVPTVSFFGPETPALYGPRGSAHSVLYKGIACSPCLNVYNSKDNSACRNNVCMKTIAVDEAWNVVRTRLIGPAARRSAKGAGGGR